MSQKDGHFQDGHFQKVPLGRDSELIEHAAKQDSAFVAQGIFDSRRVDKHTFKREEDGEE